MTLKKTHFQIAPLALLIILSAIFPTCNSNQVSEESLQIGLVCSDLNKSLDFYKNIIGMKETGGFEVDGQFSSDAGLSDNKPFKVRTLKLHDSPTATTLKLACCSDTTTARQQFVNESPGVKYLTFEVASTKAIKERLSKNGIQLLGKTPVSLGDNMEFIMVQDPDGVFVEIIGGK
jgi:catechol 2,3-dioxygenase-like lactoylglutathione lyase family enzyme